MPNERWLNVDFDFPEFFGETGSIFGYARVQTCIFFGQFLDDQFLIVVIEMVALVRHKFIFIEIPSDDWRRDGGRETFKNK